MFKSGLRAGALGILGVMFVLNVGNMQHFYLQHYVGRAVVMITGPAGPVTGGGTGFEMRVGSKVYTITNAHICDFLPGQLVATDTSDRKTNLTQIKIDRDSDLCALTPVNHTPVLSLGKHMAKNINVIGYPRLDPKRVSSGYVLGRTDIELAISETQEDGSCAPGQKAVTALFFSYCTQHFDAVALDAITAPGNSGSPVVDYLGRVVGVLFAGSRVTSYAVPLDKLQAFVSDLK